MIQSNINLRYGLTFKDLQKDSTLRLLDKKFLQFVKKQNLCLHQYLINNRNLYNEFEENYGKEDQELIDSSKLLETFLIDFFNINKIYNNYIEQLNDISQIFLFKKLFVNKYVKVIPQEKLTHYNFLQLQKKCFSSFNISDFNQEIIVKKTLMFLNNKKYEKTIQDIALWGAFILNFTEYSNIYPNQIIFFKAKKTNFNDLCEAQKINSYTYSKNNLSPFTNREGFNLYNNTDIQESLHNSNYCVKCHTRKKDHCKTGEKNTQNTKEYNKNPLGYELKGCPLSMHISQMHILNESHNLLASLCIIMINNPLLPALGDNICNDCSLSCIYQKQETVNTPLVESSILKQVLALPLGFEIYALLTRWNPLRFYRPFPKKLTKKNVLIVGAGPAGYSLAYNLHNEGHNVVICEGLKIENINNIVNINSPIIDTNKLFKELENRLILGFGGVSEYGITSRWNKNFLIILAIIIYRQKRCKIYSGMQLNASFNIQDALKLGFQHIALCMGAGSPKLLNLDNNLYGGIKTASDFLMSLHLGAFKKDNLFNLQIQLPLVVLGGGLSAIDCATEAGTYYLRQLEKHIFRYQELCKQYSEEKINSFFNQQDIQILNTLLNDYKKLQEAKKSNKLISSSELIKSMGGIKIIYYKTLQESQAYKLNYKEINNAIFQGVEFLENMNLHKINLDEFNAIKSLTFNHKDEEIVIEAKTLIVAIGNENNHYTASFNSQILNPNNNFKFKTFKGKSFSVLKGFVNHNVALSYFGDMHPLFCGSVVKAMASSFLGQYEINQCLHNIQTKSIPFYKIIKSLNKFNTHKVIKSIPLNKKMSEVHIKSKQLSLATSEGQFIKVQNFNNPNNSYASCENIMLGIVNNNKKNHTITSIILNNGASTTNFSSLNNAYIQATGGLGEKTHLEKNNNLLLIAGGIASYSLLPVIKKAYQLKNNIIMISGYTNKDDIFYQNIFKKYCNHLQISIDNSKNTHLKHIKGNIIDNLNCYIKNTSQFTFPLNKANKIIVAGSAVMMQEVQKFLALHNKQAICSLNSPMNCAMKGLCGMCIQKHTTNNKTEYFYSCKCQDQTIQNIDFSFLNSRLQQNSLQEKISHLWLKNINHNTII